MSRYDCGCNSRPKPHKPDYSPCRPPACRPEMPDWSPWRERCDDASVKLRLFGKYGDRCDHDRYGSCCDHDRHDHGRRPLPPAAPPVTIVNPWNCNERAVVTLCVDECGNLVVYVKR